MDLKCLKCFDSFKETDVSNVYATSCGHVFHSQCLTNWLERFSICPYCKQHQSNQEVIKIYICLADIPQSSSRELRNNLNSLNYELHDRVQDLKTLKEETSKSKIKQKELRKELSKLKKEVEINKGSIQFKRMAIDYHARICKSKEKHKTEAISLKHHLIKLQSLNEIINGSDSDIDAILSRSTLDEEGLSLCVDTLAEKLEDVDQINEKLNEHLITYESDLIQMEQELDSVKNNYSTLLQQLQGDKEDNAGGFDELRQNIYRLIKARGIEYLLPIFPDLDKSLIEEEPEEIISEISSEPSHSEVKPPESSLSEINEEECPKPSSNLVLKKKCKALVKNACKNPMKYLSSGRVELLDSDEEETVAPTKQQQYNSRVYNVSKLDRKKYNRVLKNRHMSAESGVKSKKSSDVNNKLPYYSVLDLMASEKKKK